MLITVYRLWDGKNRGIFLTRRNGDHLCRSHASVTSRRPASIYSNEGYWSKLALPTLCQDGDFREMIMLYVHREMRSSFEKRNLLELFKLNYIKPLNLLLKNLHFKEEKNSIKKLPQCRHIPTSHKIIKFALKRLKEIFYIL